jgi:hypothetical protein
VHCHVHKIILAVKTLSQLPVVHAVEELMRASYAYFSHSPKKYNEYKNFASTIDTKGLKIIKNVKTRWLSLLEPMKRIMIEFRTILEKMEVDATKKRKEKVISNQSCSISFRLLLAGLLKFVFFSFFFHSLLSLYFVKLLSSFPFSSILYSLCFSFLFKVHLLRKF